LKNKLKFRYLYNIIFLYPFNIINKNEENKNIQLTYPEMHFSFVINGNIIRLLFV